MDSDLKNMPENESEDDLFLFMEDASENWEKSDREHLETEQLGRDAETIRELNAQNRT